ncbi:hypothetical protein C8E03_106214 [Lachnotalea glycerini]|uniref:Uncharacterized protein n=1 Tax=Lachnotalea glycerini TaxID=1763509 RepID=A0A255IK53_9FIRM|nr:hypothetical protein [Lachnotalea glycerini]OYP32186.1 hypothetical protein CG709_06610 [Lachnotalea glycerini]PXV89562.1 hypothetical protein C8E03_106214 [Lachnotalea glycerini]RDY32261.1 hypothetical protein CG710_004565 [Lachnotalea glycerini]
MEDKTDIVIDPAVLNERTTTYSSLTDINGTNVFSNAFQEKVREYNEQENQNYVVIQEKVFVKQLNSSSDVYEIVKNEMFSNSEIKVLKGASTSEAKGIGFAIPIIGIAIVILILIMFRYIEKRRRKWASHDVDTYVYE